jgi:hypothetical protein
MDELRALLVNTAFQISDVEQSEKMLTALVTHAFYAAHGIEVGRLKAELGFSGAELVELDAVIAENATKMEEIAIGLAFGKILSPRQTLAIALLILGMLLLSLPANT